MGQLRVAKWGNSLAVRLPSELANELSLKPGDSIETPFSLIRKAKPSMTKAEALDRLRNWPRLPLPEGHAFDRDEANAR
jgi:antitoxin MazE